MGLYNRFCKRFFAAVIIRLTAQSDSRAQRKQHTLNFKTVLSPTYTFDLEPSKDFPSACLLRCKYFKVYVFTMFSVRNEGKHKIGCLGAHLEKGNRERFILSCLGGRGGFLKSLMHL